MASETLRPRVLWILKRYPWPMTNGANLRRLNLIEHLRHRFDFDLYCFEDLPDLPPELAGYFGRIISRPIPWPDPEKSANWDLKRVTNETNFLPDRETEKDLQRLLQTERYRIGIASSAMLGCLPRERRVPIVGDIIDNDCLTIWRSMRRTNNLRSLFDQIKSFASSAVYQRMHFRGLAGALYVSDSDAAFSRRVSRFPDHFVIPMGIDHTYFRLSKRNRKKDAIVFEGNMSFPPNVDAVRYLVSTILPKIRHSVPDAHLYLVGKEPHPDVMALMADKVTVTGFVDDIRPWINRAQVFVCPMRIGSGQKIKILQAWAMETPVVTTSEGTGGLLIQEGQNIVIRDTPEAFAQAVVELLRDPERARSIGRGGRRTVEESYGWEQIAARYGDSLERVMKVWKD